MKKKLVIIGSRIDGQGGVILANVLESKEYEVVGFIDDNKELHGTLNHNIRVICGTEDIEKFFNISEICTIIAVGDSQAKKRIYDIVVKKGIILVNIIDKSARITESVALGKGIYIGGNAVINNDSVIGDNVVINTGATIDHNNIIKNHATISPGCHLGGRVVVEECAFIGMGAIIVPDVVIGKNSVVGAGSVVLRSLPENSRVAGVPAKPFGKRR